MRISDWSSDVCSSDLLELVGDFGRNAGTLAAVHLGLLHPVKRLRHAANLLRDRHHRRPSRGMISLVVENHPYRGLADFRHKLVRCLAYTGSTFSGVGASDKPGAVQWSVGDRKSTRLNSS